MSREEPQDLQGHKMQLSHHQPKLCRAKASSPPQSLPLPASQCHRRYPIKPLPDLPTGPQICLIKLSSVTKTIYSQQLLPWQPGSQPTVLANSHEPLAGYLAWQNQGKIPQSVWKVRTWWGDIESERGKWQGIHEV